MKSAPWLLLVNSFTVLNVEEVNTDICEPIDAPLPSILDRKALPWKLKWEKRLPKRLSANTLDVHGTSIILSIEISTTNTSEVHSVKALLDSRAIGNFIDRLCPYERYEHPEHLSPHTGVQCGQLPQWGRSDLWSGGCSSPLGNSLRKDAPHHLQPWKAEHDPWLYLAQGPQPKGQLANWRSADEPMPLLMWKMLCNMKRTSVVEKNRG